MQLSHVLLFNQQCTLEKLSPRRAVAYSCCGQIDENGHEFQRVPRNVHFINVQSAQAQVSLERLITSLACSASIEKHR
jgi:hypothetical protein